LKDGYGRFYTENIRIDHPRLSLEINELFILYKYNIMRSLLDLRKDFFIPLFIKN
jgi:hypothetical protein